MKTGLANILYFFSTSPVLACLLCRLLMLFCVFLVVLCLGICVEVAVDGILRISRALNFH